MLIVTNVCCQSVLTLESPGKKMIARLFVNQEASLQYELLTTDKKVLVEASKLGIKTGKEILGEDVLQIKLIGKEENIDSYSLSGKHDEVNDTSITYHIAIIQEKVCCQLCIRLFDRGFAFRYDVSQLSSPLIQEELSSFKIPDSSTVWFFERNNDWKLKSYAGEWRSVDINNMATVSTTGPIQGKPLVIKLKNDYYLLLTEAALYNYSGMRLMMNKDGAFQANFSEKEFMTSASSTPWRVVLVAEDLNQLVNADMISTLNPLPDSILFHDRSYIKPGRSVWSWLTRDSNYMQPFREKQFINMASQLHFEYTLIDEGWETTWPNKWKQLKELCDYGKSKKVGLWVWRDSKYLRNADSCTAFLDSVKFAGAVGLKVDFMNSEAEPLINFETNFLKQCASRQLLVNFHGCQPPTGESRAYPNELTREGIRGLELNAMPEGPVTASHNAALPFTRFVLGHGDYTPGLFSNPGATTWAHQLACMYLFDSELFCLAENPEYILHNPDLKCIVPLLQELPVTWDQTIVLPGSDIGKFAAFARRKGSTWYVAIINGENKAKQYSFTPSFLSKMKNFKAIVTTDVAGNQIKLKRTTIANTTYDKRIKLVLEGNGGCVIKFSQQ